MLIWVGWNWCWSGLPSLSRKFLGHFENPFQFNKKVLVPLREQGQKDKFCGTTLLADEKSATSITVPTHRLPVNAGIASEDTLDYSISPCPQRPICEIAFRSALSSAELSVDALPALLPPQWFQTMLCLLYTKSVRLSRTILRQRRTNFLIFPDNAPHHTDDLGISAVDGIIGIIFRH